MRFLTALAIAWFAAASAALARVGAPVDGALGFQEAATSIMREVTSFHNLLLVIITAIVLVVLALLLWVMLRYNEKANPEPKKFSHNTLVEIIWTAVPVLILVVIAIPSFQLLYYKDRMPPEGEIDVTIKATGYQWNWGYEYPDHGISEFISNMIPDDEIGEGQLRTLSVDYPLVVPVDSTVLLQVTAGDVIHAWAIPAFGIKIDAIPGRLNEVWFRVDHEGTYYGQCSELCGLRHAFMPIEVRVVPRDVFDAWAAAAADDPDEGLALLAAYETDRRELRLAAR